MVYCVVLKGDLFVMEERAYNNIENCKYVFDKAKDALEKVALLNSI